MRVAAVLLLGGKGERFGGLKQFCRLAGKKVYLRTLETIASSSLFDQVVLVCPEGERELVSQEVLPWGVLCDVVVGGKTRQESSYAGLSACREGTEFVLIHDAVRPFVTKEILEENLRLVEEWGAVDTCTPATDTIVHSAGGETIDGIPPRREYYQGQTPQTFSYREICKAHRVALERGIQGSTDDCQLLLALGKKVAIAKGSPSNIKITTALDLFLAEQLLRTLPSESRGEGAGLLLGKKVVVTGGTGGIGAALCARLEEEGAQVFSLSPSSVRFPIDLRDASSCRELFGQICREKGNVFALVNCLGALQIKPVATLEEEEIDSLIDTNFKAVVYACRYCQIESGGHIVNIASSSYTRGRGGYAIYSAAKAAVVNFTQGLSEEREELFVNSVVPSRTDTPMRQSSIS